MAESKTEIDSCAYFPELRLSTLGDIAKGWGNDYPCIERISLYEAGGATRSGGSPLKYIFVVAVPKYKNSGGIGDGYHDWAPEAGGCDHIAESLPIFYCDQSNSKDSFYWNECIHEWMWYRIDPEDKEDDLNDESNDFIITGSKRLLYSKGKSDEIEKNIGKFPIHAELQRAFTLAGSKWFVTFDGDSKIFDDSKGLRYMLEALKYPGQVINYNHIINTVSGALNEITINNDYSNMKADQLEQEGLSTDQQIQDDDFKEQFETLKYLADGKQWDSLSKAIPYLEKEFHVTIVKNASGIPIKWHKKTSKEKSKATKLISEHRTLLLRKVKVAFPALHDHLQKYLKLKQGLLYDPPEGAPLWIIDGTNR